MGEANIVCRAIGKCEGEKVRETINVRGDKDYVVSLTNGTYSVAA